MAVKTHRYPGELLLRELIEAQTDADREIVLKKVQQRYNIPVQDYLDAAVGRTSEDRDVARHDVLKRIAYEMGQREVMLGFHRGEEDDDLPSIGDVRNALSRYHYFKGEAASTAGAYFVAFAEGVLDGVAMDWRRFRDVMGFIEDRAAIEDTVQFSSEHDLVDEMIRVEPTLPGPGSPYDLSDEGIEEFAKVRANYAYLRERATARLLSAALGRIRAIANEQGLDVDGAIAAFRDETLQEYLAAEDLGRSLARFKSELPLRRSTVERTIQGVQIDDRERNMTPHSISA